MLVAAVLAATAFAGTANAAPSLTTLTFSSTVTSVDTDLQTLPGGHTYDWNHLTGTTKWGNQSATIDFLGDVNYVNGTKIAFTSKGNALAEDEGTEGISARFTGALGVIGGTNAYARATGIGTMTGTRAAPIGSPVKLVFRLHVRK